MGSTFTNLLYHLVFSTKGRQRLITEQLEPELYKYIGGIVRGEGGKLLEIGGIEDHLHLVTRFRAQASVAHMLQLIKGSSSKWVNQRSSRSARFAWQTGYAAFSVSESQLDAVRRYVRHQKQHHRRASFEEELVQLLRKHNLEFDERYLWG